MVLKSSLPKLTLNIAIRNEEKRVATLLDSIITQTYPRERMEVLIIDGMSTDRTIEIVGHYQDEHRNLIRILFNSNKDSATGRTIGLLNATGDLHMYLDADMELAERNTLEKLVYPINIEKEIVGTFTKFLPHPRDSPLNNFLAHNPFQHDPMLEYLSASVERATVERHAGYSVCAFTPEKIPLIGVIVSNTHLLKQMHQEMKAMWSSWTWTDIDFAVALVLRGYRNFAFVADTGIYHHSLTDFGTWLKKKRRDIRGSYLSTVNARYTTYIDFASKRDLLRLLGFVIYAQSIVLPMIRGGWKAVKFRDPYCLLYEPLLAWALTDFIFALVVLDHRGRKLIRQTLRNLVS